MPDAGLREVSGWPAAPRLSDEDSLARDQQDGASARRSGQFQTQSPSSRPQARHRDAASQIGSAGGALDGGTFPREPRLESPERQPKCRRRCAAQPAKRISAEEVPPPVPTMPESRPITPPTATAGISGTRGEGSSPAPARPAVIARRPAATSSTAPTSGL